MFRNPNWFVYRKPLRSSFCTCVSLSMSCDVVCFFLPVHPADSHKLPWPSEGFFGHRRSKGHLRISCDQRRLRTRQVQLAAAQPLFCRFLQQFVYHNRERMGVGCSQVCMVVRCGDAQEAACCECFVCDGGRPSSKLLSCRFWQGVYSVRNARYRLLFRVDKAPPAMVGCGHTHWHRLLQYAQQRHATETLWGSRSGEWPSFWNEVVGYVGCTAWWVCGEGCLSCHATICQMFSKSLLRLGTAVDLRAQLVFIPLVNIAIGTARTNTFRVRGVSQKTSEFLPRFTFHFWQEEDLDMFVKWGLEKMWHWHQLNWTLLSSDLFPQHVWLCESRMWRLVAGTLPRFPTINSHHKSPSPSIDALSWSQILGSKQSQRQRTSYFRETHIPATWMRNRLKPGVL